MRKRILRDFRILDFSWVLAGPFATRILADFGAEVIKVQPILPEAEDRFSRGYYNTWNRNKLGITLNMNKPEGLEIARKLAGLSDAVVENFTPRVMENWRLDYPNLKLLKPDIILLSLSTMGHSGPWRDFVGFGPTVQAFSGITCLTAYPGRPPLGLGYAYADHIAGLYGCLALLGALEYRRKTGKGQFIDLSQTETMTSLLSNAILDYTRDAKEPRPAGDGSDASAPWGVYPCRGNDRWCAISVQSDEEWEGFKRALGNPGWAESAEFSSSSARLHNTVRLDGLIIDWTRLHTAEEVTGLLQNEGVPAGIVQSAADLVEDPQLKFRGFFRESGLPGEEKVKFDACPINLSRSRTGGNKPAPARGRDNYYVYRHLLGMTARDIRQLQQDRVI